MLRHQEISDFSTLVNKCRMVEDDMKADEVVASRSLPPKNFGPHRNFVHGKGKSKAFPEEGKPYSSPMGNIGYAPHGSRTHANAEGSQQNPPSWCNKCGRKHFGDSCPGSTLSCYYCKGSGHLKRHCPKLRQRLNDVRAERPRSTGRVFTMNGAETSNADDLIRGNCMVPGIPLLVLFDSGATHSFVSNDCVDRLKLQTESLLFELVVSTPTDVPVVVSTVVSRCPVVVNGRTFTVDLICLPLSQLDLILGMD
ncbi:hypothetical protein Lal_00043556 [Lupinus albus]|nr:hypothetical protein Lal_00043556 [Lupinus albus]